MSSEATAAFEAERPHLFGIAYRMLGSAAEADDVLQEAFVRWNGLEEDTESPRAYLTTVVVRLCLDHLKSARARRELYVGPWLPEPIAGTDDVAARPDARAELAESLSIAFLAL
ncbi:MAG TPA: sigma factor, partial [Polyangia bacterium]